MKFPKFLSENDSNDLKKFESLSDMERSITFYAENTSSLNHLQPLITELTEKRKIQICYVTSVKDDPILFSQNEKILSFYIGTGMTRTKFFLFLKARILVMDMPDLNTFHIKRSIKYPVHYIYLFHSMFSIHSYLRKGAIDNYDTIFCVGPHHKKEILETEKVYELKPKNLVEYGFGRLDTLLENKKLLEENHTAKKLIIIAPSYGENNLIEKCGIKLIDMLLKSGFSVLLRPHHKTIKNSKKLINSITNTFGKNPNFILEEGVIPFNSLNDSVCMISDWSGISLEYAFVFERPIIFIDVPKKILNPNSNDIHLEPIEVSIREDIGYIVSPENLSTIPSLINNQSNNSQNFNDHIDQIRKKTVYHIGESARIGSDYIQELNNELNN
jgi:YidC/Oxa1 family membrane protein insertase